MNLPPDTCYWQPCAVGPPQSPEPENIQPFVNTYDSAIKYNLDRFFQNLVSDYKNIPHQTAIIFTSDHGQTLSEDGKTIRTHGGDSKLEASVPLFMLGVEQVDTGFKASHENIFPTILELMNYPPDLLEQKHAVSLLKAKASDSTPRYFFGNQLSERAKIKFD